LEDVFASATHELDEQIEAIGQSLRHTRELIISSHQHVKESRAALQRADVLIASGVVPRAAGEH
jgi:hypothetical protein